MRRSVLIVAVCATAIAALSADQRIRLRTTTAASAADPSPYADNLHPRLGFHTSGDTYDNIPSIGDLRTKINRTGCTTDVCKTLRKMIGQAVVELDAAYAAQAPAVTGCTAATPSVCTVATAHGMLDQYPVVFYGVSSTPAINGVTYYVDVQSTTTFALYTDSSLTTPKGLTGAGTGGVMAYQSFQPMMERAFAYAFLGHYFSGGGTLRNEADTANITPTYTGAQYGRKAADVFVAQIGQWIAAGYPTPYVPDALWPGILTPYAADWAWEWFTTSERADVAAFLENSKVTSFWTQTDHQFNNGATQMKAYMALNSAVLGNSGYSSAFWATVASDVPTLIGDHARSVPRSFSQYSGGADAALTESTTYQAYTFPVSLLAVMGYRTAFNLAKTDYYSLATHAHYVRAPVLATAMFRPYFINSSLIADGKLRALTHQNYSHSWLDSDLTVDNLFSFGPSVTASEMGHLDSNAAGLGMWVAANRSFFNYAVGTGSGLGKVQGPAAWVIRAVFGDEDVAAITPSSAGLSSSIYVTNSAHYLRGHLTDDNVGLTVFYAPKWGTGAAVGRSPHWVSGSFDYHYKGPASACQGGIGHNLRPSSFCHQSFPPMTRARADNSYIISTGGSFYDDIGGVRLVGFHAQTTAGSSEAFVADGLADFRGEHRYKHANASRRFDWVYLDNTKAYYYDASVDNTENPVVVDFVATSFFHLRGAATTDPVRIVRIDRWNLDDAKVGVNEPVLTFVPSAEPTITGGGSYTAITRNGTSQCQGHYGAATKAAWSTTASPGTGYAYDMEGEMHILAPAARQVIVRGGPNESAAKWNVVSVGHANNSCEAVDAVGFRWNPFSSLTTTYVSAQAAEIGPYAIEIRDTSGADSGSWVTGYYAGAVASTPTTPVLLTSSATVRAVRWDNDIVVAGVGSDIALTNFDFTIDAGAGTYRVLYTDLPAGSSRGVSCTNSSSVVQVDPTDSSSPFTTSNTGEDKGQLYLEIITTAVNAVCTVS